MKPSLELILITVSSYYEVEISEMKSKSKIGNIVKARQVFCYLSNYFTINNHDKIGKIINRDRTTALYSIEKIKKEKDFYIDLYLDLNNLKEKLKTPEIVVSNVNLLQLAINHTKSFL